MEKIIWLVIMIPCSALFTGIGIFAWKRTAPMWFWAGSTVSEDEISDIPAYNRANGIMWIVYSLVFWFSTFACFISMNVAGVSLGVGSLAGIPVLVVAYNRIYDRYRAGK